MTGTTAAIDIRQVSRRFGAAQALSDASLSVLRGSLHMLLGENGAGKTTLARIAAGLLAPDSGTVQVDGRPVHDPVRGIGFVHQHFSLVPAMTVAENILLAETRWWARIDQRRSHSRIRDLSREAGLDVDPAMVVQDLTVGEQQRVEIVRALATAPHTLILDEPTAALAPGEAAELYRWLRAYVARGHTALVITHRVREVLAHADAVTVLRRGRVVLQDDRSRIAEHALLQAIVGEGLRTPDPGAEPVQSARSPDTAIVALEAVACQGTNGAIALRDTSLTVGAGEIVGVAGVEGSGCRELIRLLAGRLEPTRGTVRRVAGPIGFVPEDRLEEGLIAELTVLENFALRSAASRDIVLRWNTERTAALEAIERFDVRGGQPELPASALSGGNQQRLILAREFSTNPILIVAENPTRGLDVRASRDVAALFAAASARGAAVVVYSSDLDELASLAQRVLVCHGGRVVSVAPDVDAMGAALTGAVSA